MTRKSLTPIYLALLCGTLVYAQVLCAVLPPTEHSSAGEAFVFEPLNVNLPTLGGKQFWGDELLFPRWRIQRNVLTGHFRLLDEDNVRHAWGSFAACQRKLDQIKQARSLPPMRGRVVLV